jgi:hypothetical protein
LYYKVRIPFMFRLSVSKRFFGTWDNEAIHFWVAYHSAAQSQCRILKVGHSAEI